MQSIRRAQTLMTAVVQRLFPTPFGVRLRIKSFRISSLNFTGRCLPFVNFSACASDLFTLHPTEAYATNSIL